MTCTTGLRKYETMLNAIQIIAERKITEAIREGKLRTEAWKGKPLPSEASGFVPADLKMAYKILKNAGYLPPEIETRKEIQKLEELIAENEDEHTRVRQLKKLNVLLLKLNSMRQRPVNLEVRQEYHRKVVEKVAVNQKTARQK